MILPRPYGVIANPDQTPTSIFVSTFDTAPLAPEYDFVLKEEGVNIQTGIDVLRKLTSGSIHLGVEKRGAVSLSSFKGVEMTNYSGKHPAGNVGVHIHHVDPVNKGEVVWTVNIQDLAIIGRLFSTGKVDMSKIIAVKGSEVSNHQ